MDRKIIVSAVAGLALVAIIVITVIESMGDGETTACSADLDEVHNDYEDGVTIEEQLVLMTVLADLPSNDSAGAAYVANAVAPILDEIVYENALAIRFVAHTGEGQIEVSECLNGLTMSALHQNDRRRAGNLLSMRGAILNQIEADITRWTVASTGGVMPLLREVESSPIRGDSDEGNLIADHLVIIVSDLLANDGSCLDGSPTGIGWVDGDPIPYADASLADSIIARCVAEGQLPRIEAGERWVLVGIGASDRSAGFGYFADTLGSGLCEALGDRCTAAVREVGLDS